MKAERLWEWQHDCPKSCYCIIPERRFPEWNKRTLCKMKHRKWEPGWKWVGSHHLTVWSFSSSAICMCLALSCIQGTGTLYLSPKIHQRLVLSIWWGTEEKEIIGCSHLLSKDILEVSWSSDAREGHWESGPESSSDSGHSCDSVDLELALPVEVRAVRSAVPLCVSFSVP